MIDGDFNHQTCSFLRPGPKSFEAAQRNAPSVIFIDDADVILTDPRLAYFGRYLLTQLDGLMNEASGRICVMMTAMDLKGLPLALLRSGRMEVWLEMKLPDAEARSGIIETYINQLPIKPPAFDTTSLGKQTDGFTPADLRRLVADATGHLALDRHLGRSGAAARKPISVERRPRCAARSGSPTRHSRSAARSRLPTIGSAEVPSHRRY